MTFSISEVTWEGGFTLIESSYPDNEPLTPTEYAAGQRDPYWFARFVVSEGLNTNTPYIPRTLVRNESAFYRWCAERGIRTEIVYVGLKTIIYAYIQDERLAVEAKMWFG